MSSAIIFVEEVLLSRGSVGGGNKSTIVQNE